MKNKHVCIYTYHARNETKSESWLGGPSRFGTLPARVIIERHSFLLTCHRLPTFDHASL